MAFVYVLFSEKLDKYYIGSTIDKERRLIEHNRGKEKFTSTGTPWQMIYTEEFPTLEEARLRELRLKKMKSRKYVEWLLKKG